MRIEHFNFEFIETCKQCLEKDKLFDKIVINSVTFCFYITQHFYLIECIRCNLNIFANIIAISFSCADVRDTNLLNKILHLNADPRFDNTFDTKY